MHRRFQRLSLITCIALLGSPAVEAQNGTTELRFATLAPEGSPWMNSLRRWDRALREESGGSLGLRIYPGGSQGQEPMVIDKMAAGQLDGAALTTTGLSQIVRPVLVLGLASVIGDYEALDRVRRRMGRRFEGYFAREGYVLAGWGDVGRARLFSRTRIERPRDLRRARVWAPRTDEVFSEFLSTVGARPRRLGVTEVYPALQTGMVDAVPASGLAVVALQWHTRLRYYTEQSAGVLIGATVFRRERLEALSESQRALLASTGRGIARRAQRLVRRADDEAMRTLSRRLTAVDTTRHEGEWLEAGRTTLERLEGRVFPAALIEAVVRAAAE